MRLINYISSLIVLVLAAVACEHKERCYNHPHQPNVNIDVDWATFDKETPSGMTMMIYDEEGESEAHIRTNDIAKVQTYLREGVYNSVVFNQSETEFANVSFHGLSNISTAQVRAVRYVCDWYDTKSDTKAKVDSVAMEPEWIGSDKVSNYIVTKEMATTRGILYDVADHYPENITKTIFVRIAVEGIQNFYGARASLSGLAEGYMLGHQRPSEKEATYLLDFWITHPDPEDPDKGYIIAQVNNFGLPHGHKGRPQDNILEINILLKDNKTQLNYTFEVGHQIEVADGWADPDVSLDLKIDKPFPDVEQSDQLDGGFDATVDGWGDEEDHDIKM